MNFENLKLISPILEALREQGYTAPTPIQEKAIPPALEGKNVLGCAQTGTGKTCAFAVPILQRLTQSPVQGHPIRTLILTPTRELAIQIQECFEAYGKHLPLRSTVIFGGVSQVPQAAALKRGTDILVATPGRLADLYGQKLIDLSRVEILVLDEADRMLDMGFIHDVKRILAWLPEKKQTLFFSATMPKEITDLVNSIMHQHVRVEADPVSSPVEAIEQHIYFVDKSNKTKLLAQLIKRENITSALVFTRTKHGANKVATDLGKQGISAAAIHGNKSQTARQNALEGFKAGSVRVLVATDIAARGIDIEELPYVFNYNLPEVPETYVHRIGRTGRAGHEGIAISFCDFGEKPMLKDIEKLIHRSLPVVGAHDFPMEVFEAPKKDARGRMVNEEDAEARAAAKERRRARDAANQAAAQSRKSAGNPAAPQGQGKQSAGNAPAKKQSAPKQNPPRQSAPQPAADASSKKRRKQTRSSGGTALPTVKLPQEPVVSASYDYSEFPNLAKREDPLAANGRVMDATAKLFASHSSKYRDEYSATHPSYKPEPEERRPANRKKGGQKPSPARQPAAQPAPAKAEEESASKRARSKKKPAAQKSAAQPANRLLNVPNKKRRSYSRPPRMERSPYASQKDSTEQNSLMKPYYITKD